ncbi:MAG: SbcC/MukB-like Walker B domain-containing protein, partial [Kofleriaceae bacterium]
RAHELERERALAERLAGRQAQARALAGALAIDAAATVMPELEQVERALRALELEADVRRAELAARQHREAELRDRLASLDDRIARWQLAGATASRLAPTGPTPASRADVSALRDRLALELHALGERRKQLEAARQELQQRATIVEQSGTSLDPELLRLRDELGGELLASRFEDLDLAAASWVEARLGPLTGALIVDDLTAAVTAVEQSKRLAPTVWLVEAGAVVAIEPPEDIAELDEVSDVVSVEPFGLRITRRLPRPSLGRRARERQVREIHDAIARDGAALDEVAQRSKLVASWRRDVEVLDLHFDALLAGDPAGERAQLHAELAALEPGPIESSDETHRARVRLDGLRRLLRDLALLDPPDHAARATELAALQAELADVTADLIRLAPARSVLAELVDVLRSPPPDDAALRERTERTLGLVARLDELAAARAALEDVLVHRHAAAFADAEAALDARTGLAPALEAQHADARAAVQTAAEAEATLEAVWETATQAAQLAEANRLVAVAHRDRAAAELAGFGTIAEVIGDVDALAARVAVLDLEARDLVTQRALAAERLERAIRGVDEARARLAAATRDAGPAVAAWSALRDSAQADGLLHAVLAGPRTDRTSIQLAADAWSKRELLIDRVARARGGDELVTAIRDTALDGPGYLASWQATREWLRRRVPAQVADVDEPLVALERLRDHLDVLEGRLGRQEHDLRGASEDVARGIDVQVRRAHGQVRRLNTQLEGIQFGSIHGIRVEIRRIDRMEQILRALRLGEAQELLFMSSIPIEEALDEIFRRYGGGGRAGGQRLLDYREYLELAVEIRRQTSGVWETASPTKLSTGEAIGVGAALMMVVLTEWERDANLLRARRTGGSLRFLFLDEANRLSRDNLGVLFDLCKNLDLQLLIAAPEVARAEGNTTYRLVRHVTDDGREEVIVSGRRSIEVPEPAAPPSA